MKRSGPVSLLLLLLVADAWAQNGWELTDTQLAVDFNGASTGDDGFQVLVGDGGTIVHPQLADTAVPSGTAADLFDVFVADAQTAVAVGRDTVLRWDGSAWTPIVEETADQVFTSVWITPEKDFAFFNVPGGTFTTRRAIDLATNRQAPLAAVSGFDIAYCGRSNDVKSVNTVGTIQHFDNELMPGPGSEGAQGVLFDNTATPRNLTAAWFPPGACPPFELAPLDAFAIDSNREFYRFDPDTGWTVMPVDGGGVPAGQTLTWLAGAGGDYVLAAGFKPAPMGGGNEAVLWIWDGVVWREESTFPAGTPGLSDLAYRFTFEDDVFASGFEPANPGAKNVAVAGVEVDILAAAEAGRRLSNNTLFPVTAGPVTVQKAVLEYVRFPEGGGTLTYEFKVTNRAPNRVVVIILDFASGVDELESEPEGRIELLEETCMADSSGVLGDSLLLKYEFGVNPGESERCEVSYSLTPGQEPAVVLNRLGLFVRAGTNTFQDSELRIRTRTMTGY